MLRRIRSAVPDMLVLAGLALFAFGMFEAWAPLGPVTLGLGLIAAVRFGAPAERSR